MAGRGDGAGFEVGPERVGRRDHVGDAAVVLGRGADVEVGAQRPGDLVGELGRDERGLPRAVRDLVPPERELVLIIDQFEEITNFWQAGIAFGKEDRPIKLWFLRFDRLGLAYDISPSGEMRGIKFVFRSLYEP